MITDNPMIRELFRQLPPAGSAWPINEQVRWLRAADATIALLYGSDEVLTFTIVRQSAAAITPSRC